MRFHDLHQNAPGWQTLEDAEPFANPYAAVHLVKVGTPMRPEGARWTVIHRKAACVIAPITPEGNLLLIRQERIPVRSALWEFPAGQIDEAGTPNDALIRQTALRELREEAGCILAPGGKLTALGFFFSSPGIMDEQNYLFAAHPVIPCPEGAAHEAAEAIAECRAFTPEELRERIASGEIRDANTLAAFARLTALGIL
ncbi:MAG: NUDIX hydrolase [Verrucomicrobiota bacterium]